jgi:hypothetical protein
VASTRRAAVEFRRPPLEIAQVGDQALQQLAGERWQAMVLDIGDHGQELAQADLPSSGDDPELGQVAPQSVDRGGALLQQLLAHPVQHQHRLLVLILGRDKPHAGALHRLAAGLGIGRVVLVGLDVGPHVLRRHQPHLVPEPGQLTGLIVGCTAGLQPDQASRQGCEELEHLAARQLALEQHVSLHIGAVQLKQVLGDVEANSSNLHSDVSRLRGRCTPLPRWHFDAVSGRRPSHHSYVGVTRSGTRIG